MRTCAFGTWGPGIHLMRRCTSLNDTAGMEVSVSFGINNIVMIFHDEVDTFTTYLESIQLVL